MIPIGDLRPERGTWIGDFCDWADARMSAPDAFKLGVAISIISACLGGAVRFQIGPRTNWTSHVWMLLLGPPAAKKSTPIYVASDFVRRARGEDAFLSGRWTVEGLQRALGDCSDPFWNIGELEGLLGHLRKEYMGGGRSELSDLWDGGRFSAVLAKQTRGVEHSAVTGIATGRVTDFEDIGGYADFSSGMLSRFILLETSDPGTYVGMRSAAGYSDEITGILEADLHGRLKHVSAWHGGDHTARFTDEAIDLWQHVDQQWQNELADLPREVSGFAGRRGVQSAKLAVLASLSRNAQTTQIHVEASDVAWGQAVAEQSYATAERVAVEEVGRDRDAPRRDRILNRIRRMTAAANAKAEPLSERDLTRSVHRLLRNERDLDEQIGLLVRAGEIRRGYWKTDDGDRRAPGRPAACLWGTEHGDPPVGWIDR